ncbi:FGGY-family carbohydrate kinase [Rhizobium sp. TRM95796]|uniref:FGGY-family carbohydrate kinase n=1 Tax=Rhizobium sp. TRM95796 TaxID=2979862 RepID=UPI0021E9A07A|nr:FGGY-family carbohydrate kinase [Rhizobium sp. TRM95796]MCV3765945.1 FGGY-family carbohydrate kinase [Rhizobium sp. TRM95796]
MTLAHAIGIDLGTSGVRAAALSEDGAVLHLAAFAYDDAPAGRDPSSWWRGVEICLFELAGRVSLSSVRGLAVDGTSGTMLAVDKDGRPLGDVLMYNDTCPDMDIVARIGDVAPDGSPARGAASALARAIYLSRRDGVHKVVHQADWILWRLGLGGAASDENNALKTGYDLEAECWPDWLEGVGMDVDLLPQVHRAGAPIAEIGPSGQRFGLSSNVILHAGTTDGCASFLATGAREAGDGVTALGSTLVLKLACPSPISSSVYGVYSHRVLGFWLAGGASNSGGAVIRSLFDAAALAQLTSALDPDHPTGLDYYPLLRPGERFPINDPTLPPRLVPRPAHDATFFQGVLEGITGIEKSGYDRLVELGGPALRSIRSVGGGAANAGWTRMRERALGVPCLEPRSAEAAVGAAFLVLSGQERQA